MRGRRAESPKLPLGARVKYYRRKHGNRSQAAIAGLCGITERYLSLIETGKRTPSPDLLARLAAELDVPVAALLSDEPPVTSTASLTTAPDIARALMGYGAARSGPAAAPAQLRERIEHAWSTWQTSQERFTDVEQLLPSLIANVEDAVRFYRTGSE